MDKKRGGAREANSDYPLEEMMKAEHIKVEDYTEKKIAEMDDGTARSSTYHILGLCCANMLTDEWWENENFGKVFANLTNKVGVRFDLKKGIFVDEIVGVSKKDE